MSKAKYKKPAPRAQERGKRKVTKVKHFSRKLLVDGKPFSFRVSREIVAVRDAEGHTVTVDKGLVSRYQAVTPADIVKFIRAGMQPEREPEVTDLRGLGQTEINAAIARINAEDGYYDDFDV